MEISTYKILDVRVRLTEDVGLDVCGVDSYEVGTGTLARLTSVPPRHLSVVKLVAVSLVQYPVSITFELGYEENQGIIIETMNTRRCYQLTHIIRKNQISSNLNIPVNSNVFFIPELYTKNILICMSYFTNVTSAIYHLSFM